MNTLEILEDKRKKLEEGSQAFQSADYGKAIPLLGKLFNENPKNPLLALQLALSLERLGHWQKALEVYRVALKHNPTCGELYNNVGNVYKEQRLLEKSIHCYKQSTLFQPNLPEPHSNLGSIYQLQGKIDDAFICYEKALIINPNHTPTRLNRALSYLLLGDYEKGFKEYEWRLKEQNIQQRIFDKPQLTSLKNNKDLKNKTLLVHAEQGFGDTIQFIRYLPLMKELGATIIFECQPELECVLKNMKGYFDQLTVKTKDKKKPVEYDYHVPLLSLPSLFQTTLKTIPENGPYLFPNLEKQKLWEERLNSSKLNVGLCWAGNSTHRHDRYRSCPLKQLLPLEKISFARFFSLQKGSRATDLSKVQTNIINLDSDIQSFEDTLAIISNLDLVITVDTSVAHLAGAAGKPVWLLLPYTPDWRWGLKGETSPWYPNIRLFRQPRLGNWKSVIHEVREELKRLQ